MGHFVVVVGIKPVTMSPTARASLPTLSDLITMNQFRIVSSCTSNYVMYLLLTICFHIAQLYSDVESRILFTAAP